MRTQIKEISHKGSSSVVEWIDSVGNVNRSVLPSTEIINENGKLYVEDPDEGAFYGVHWESLFSVIIGPKEVAALLRKRGIWTVEDYASNTSVVTNVLNEMCSVNRQQFQEAVLGHIQGRK